MDGRRQRLLVVTDLRSVVLHDASAVGASNMLQRPSNFGKISAFESSKSPLRAKRRPVMKCRPGPLPIPVVVRPKKTPLPLASSWPVGDVPSANSCASPMWKPIASTTICCASANAVKSRRAPIKRRAGRPLSCVGLRCAHAPCRPTLCHRSQRTHRQTILRSARKRHCPPRARSALLRFTHRCDTEISYRHHTARYRQECHRHHQLLRPYSAQRIVRAARTSDDTDRRRDEFSFPLLFQSLRIEALGHDPTRYRDSLHEAPPRPIELLDSFGPRS